MVDIWALYYVISNKKVLCIKTVCLFMLLNITSFGIILMLYAFVFFSYCRMAVCTEGETGSQTETSLVEKIATVL